MPHPNTTLISAHVPSAHSFIVDGTERTITLSFGNELTALVGRNGIGKTRFAKTVIGQDTLPGVTVAAHGSIGYLPQETLHNDRENLSDVLGLTTLLESVRRIEHGQAAPADLDLSATAWKQIAHAEAALEKLGIVGQPWSRPMHTFSGGEQTRTALAKLVLDAPSFLILDEPTNHLDTEARAYIYELLSQWRGGALVVTHDRKILSMAAQIVEISDLGFRLYRGNFDDFQIQRAEERENAKRKADAAHRQLRAAQRERQRSKEKAQKRDAQGIAKRKRGGASKSQFDFKKWQAEKTQSRDKVKFERKIDQMRQHQQRVEKAIEHDRGLRFEAPRADLRERQRVLKLSSVGFRYPGSSEPVLSGMDLEMFGPEKVALVGRNGSGKSTLLKLLDGSLVPCCGRVEVYVDNVVLLDQHTAFLDPALTVQENFQRMNPEISAQESRAALAAFLFRGEESAKRTGWLSGGERMRAALACLLCAKSPPQLLLLDEPTNHLDLASLDAVTQALGQFDGAMMVTSHDETFLQDLKTDREIDLSLRSP